jgi:hypothetical protein
VILIFNIKTKKYGYNRAISDFDFKISEFKQGNTLD